jgi:hypothetical protein
MRRQRIIHGALLACSAIMVAAMVAQYAAAWYYLGWDSEQCAIVMLAAASLYIHWEVVRDS